jgi:ammonia channel protein AmtB
VRSCFGVRVNGDDEEQGLDLSQHGEEGYFSKLDESGERPK